MPLINSQDFKMGPCEGHKVLAFTRLHKLKGVKNKIVHNAAERAAMASLVGYQEKARGKMKVNSTTVTHESGYQEARVESKTNNETHGMNEYSGHQQKTMTTDMFVQGDAKANIIVDRDEVVALDSQ